jgi:hypothetical protein
VDDDQVKQLAIEVAKAIISAQPKRSSPSLVSIAGVVLAVIMPLTGWLVSVSNRVAVLESDNSHLSTAAVEISALKQELSDFRREYEQDKINTRVVDARGNSADQQSTR